MMIMTLEVKFPEFLPDPPTGPQTVSNTQAEAGTMQFGTRQFSHTVEGDCSATDSDN